MQSMEIVKKAFKATPKLIKVVVIFFAFNLSWELAELWGGYTAKIENFKDVIIFLLSRGVYITILSTIYAGALGIMRDQVFAAQVSMSRFIEYSNTYFKKILPLLAIVLAIDILSSVAAPAMKSVVFLIRLVLAGVIIKLYAFIIVTLDNITSFAAIEKAFSILKAQWKDTLALFGLTFFVGALVIVTIISIGEPFFSIIGLVINVRKGMVSMVIQKALMAYLEVFVTLAFMLFYVSLEQRIS